MAQPKDMHWSDVKAELEKQGTSLADIAHALGIARANVSKVSRRPSHNVQSYIAKILNMKPQNIWPTRYYVTNGKPIGPSIWMRNNSRTTGTDVKNLMPNTAESNTHLSAILAAPGSSCRLEDALNYLFLNTLHIGTQVASDPKQRPHEAWAKITIKPVGSERAEMRIETMGNLLSFPMSTWDILKGKEVAPSESLLVALGFLRDCLEDGVQNIDDPTVQRCLDATDTALTAAMSTERTMLTQSRRIEEIERIASTDELTGAYNRRGFEQEFQRVLAAANRYGETGVLIYVDLDGFKPINDTYGHAAGDHVLCEVVHTLHENVRPHDLVARLGGDEFAVLLTRTDWENGLERAEVLKHILNTKYVNWNDKHIAVRASLGFQRFGPDDCHKKLLIKADTAMYESKRVRTKTAKGGANADSTFTELR